MAIIPLERCSKPCIIREMQIKIMKYHFTPTMGAIIIKQRIARVGKKVKKVESLYIVLSSEKWCSS